MNCVNCVFLRKPFTPASCALRSRPSSNVQAAPYTHATLALQTYASASSQCVPPVDGAVASLAKKPIRSQCSVFVNFPITTFLMRHNPPFGPMYIADEVRSSARGPSCRRTPHTHTTVSHPTTPRNPTAPLKTISHLAPHAQFS